jgi:malonyl-CoA/methylmalonyl-CoA synthetase
MLQIFNQSLTFSNKTAIIRDKEKFSYEDLQKRSNDVATWLLNKKTDLNEERVAFMITPGFDYVAIQWGIWKAGGIAVPLCISYPLPSLAYVIDDTKATIVITDDTYFNYIDALIEERKLRFINISKIQDGTIEFPVIDPSRRAMILYTSGTTNLPKGVVTTHQNICAQVTTLIKAWQWTSEDHILCVLPLHHVHGIINVVTCALWAGATLQFLPNFSEEKIYDEFLKDRINVFMAVPTIYFKLIANFDQCDEEKQNMIKASLKKFRLMVSGSAALPVTVMEKWKVISGHTLLERYGMTEIGMGISNPYIGERKAGYIGKELAGVNVRLVDENNEEVSGNQAGEIQVKGANVFKEYWGKAEATQKAFTNDGWFRTGDIAVIEEGYYRILGRDSIDIIKSGGYKISALEIEEVLRTNEAIVDCSVIGIPNEEWGELVVCVIVINSEEMDLNELNNWLRSKMPSYKTPRQYKVVKELPRNAMGKVTKNDLKSLFIN